MKVRIIKSECWHAGMIGREFNVSGLAFDGYCQVTDEGEHKGNGLYSDDYEVVEEDGKVVEYEGVKYTVPSWAKFLSRDTAGSWVYAWANKPVYSEETGYYTPDGKRQRVEEYVPPKPEGNFLVNI